MKYRLYIFNFKKIKIIIIFLLCFFIADRSIASLFFYLNKYSSLPHSELYSGNGLTEIMILGNSRGYRSFDENLIENKTKKKTKNYSLIGSSTIINEIIIKDYINIYKESPKVLLFEITDLLSVICALKVFRIYGYKSNEISKLLKKNYPKLYYSSIVSNIFIFNNSTFFNSIQKIFVKYKYKSLTGEINKINFPSEKKTFTKNEFSKQNINSLKRIIKLCEEKKIKLILVIAPFYSEKLNYEKKEFDLWKSNIKKNINNIEIIDFSLSFTNKKFFNDWKHINKKGTQEFNKIFFKNRIISDILL